MRLALISDIHANLEALEATFYDIAERSIDRIVCLGDIVGYNSDAAACIAMIRGADCVCVAGNHDLAVCGRITTRKFSSAAARAVAWTREQLSDDDLDFLEKALNVTDYDRLYIPGGAGAMSYGGSEFIRAETFRRALDSGQ